jgi:tetratricopeptide (TPR) repeat protein
MTDDEKNDFLLDRGTDYVELVQDYILDLKNKGDYEKIQDFYKKSIEKHKDFFPLQFIMGAAYLDKDPALAKSYFEEVVKSTEKSEELPEQIKKALRADMDQLIKLATEESAEKPEEKTDEGKKGKVKSKTGKKASKNDLYLYSFVFPNILNCFHYL